MSHCDVWGWLVSHHDQSKVSLLSVLNLILWRRPQRQQTYHKSVIICISTVVWTAINGQKVLRRRPRFQKLLVRMARITIRQRCVHYVSLLLMKGCLLSWFLNCCLYGENHKIGKLVSTMFDFLYTHRLLYDMSVSLSRIKSVKGFVPIIHSLIKWPLAWIAFTFKLTMRYKVCL